MRFHSASMSGSVGSGAADHPQQRAGALLDDARVARVQAQLALGVGLVEHLAVPAPLADGRVVLVAAQEQVPERPQHAALGLERDVDGLERDAGLGRDRRHRRRRVALLLEQPLRRVEDLPPRRGRLLAPARRVVAARGLDSARPFRYSTATSLLVTSNQLLVTIQEVCHGSEEHRRPHRHALEPASAPTSTACGLRWPARGRSTRPTSTRAARSVTERMLELTAPQAGRARARAGVRAGAWVWRPRARSLRAARSSCPTSSPR